MNCKIKKVVFAFDADKAGMQGVKDSIKKFCEHKPNLEFAQMIFKPDTDAGDAYNTATQFQSHDKFWENMITAPKQFGTYHPKGKAGIGMTRNSIVYTVDLGIGLDAISALEGTEFDEDKGKYNAYRIDTTELKKILFYPSTSNQYSLPKKIEDIVNFIKSQPIEKCNKTDRDNAFYIKCTFINKGTYKEIGGAWIYLLLGQMLQKEVKRPLFLTQTEFSKKLKISKRTLIKYEQRLIDMHYLRKKQKKLKYSRIFSWNPKHKEKK